jgi:hypothetical protein
MATRTTTTTKPRKAPTKTASPAKPAKRPVKKAPRGEARLLNLTERELVAMVRPSVIGEMSATELKAAQLRLRAARDRARRIARTQERQLAGEAAPRRRRTVRDTTGSVGKVEVLLKALDGIAAEVKSRRKPTQAEIARKALAMKKATQGAKRPAAGRTPKRAAAAKPGTKPTKRISGPRKGAVSASGKRAQAKRDGR